MSELKTRIHEAGHAVMLMHLGYVPERICVSNKPRVDFDTDRMTVREIGMVAYAGHIAVDQLLGEENSGSAEDDQHIIPWLMEIYSYGGKPGDAHRDVWPIVYQLRAEIKALADELAKCDDMSPALLAACCGRNAKLRQFSGLFQQRQATVAMSTQGVVPRGSRWTPDEVDQLIREMEA